MIYICIPTYNEERTVGVLLWKIRTVMGAFGRDYQILVVDDASDDRTQEVLAPYTRVLPLQILRNEKRQGYARALEQSIREAVRRAPYPKRDVVVTLQADFTEEPGQIEDLVKRLEGGVDIVTGELEMAPDPWPSGARWSRRAWSFLLRHEGAQAGAHDPLSGFRAYRVFTLKRALQDAGDGPLLTAEGWAANAELLAKALPHARRAEEVPVHMRYDRHGRPSRFDATTTARQVLTVLTEDGAGEPAEHPSAPESAAWSGPAGATPDPDTP